MPDGPAPPRPSPAAFLPLIDWVPVDSIWRVSLTTRLRPDRIDFRPMCHATPKPEEGTSMSCDGATFTGVDLVGRLPFKKMMIRTGSRSS